MSDIKDTASVTLNVNGAQAKQVMADLQSKIDQTKNSIAAMKQQMANPKDIQKAQNQLKKYEKQMDEIQSATEGVGKVLGSLDKATPRQLEKTLRLLNKQLKDMPQGSEVWNSHVEQIKQVKKQLEEVRGELKLQESGWDKLTGFINKGGATIAAVALGADQAIAAMRGWVDEYAQMDQEQANVRKFTGMTEEQVAALNEEFKKMDTRTSREGLNQLAQEAGRLGKTSQEDVLGFVRAADQINVALDDLGEGATLTLSKLTGIFGDEARYGTEKSLLKVGSVINELSQNCAASAPYLAEFASRMGGVAAQSGMTSSEVLAFGAVLDSNNQALEASSTALSQVIVRMMQDPAKYAKVAGLDVQKFSNLLKTDVNGALILFLETLNKAGGMDVLSPMFADMDENGARAISALSTLATHIDDLKAQQQVANEAFREGTSIGKEFAVQNNTVEAALEKCKNSVHELHVALGEKIYPMMGYVIKSGAALTKMFNTMVDFIIQNKGAVLSLAAAIVSYTVTLKAAVIWDKTFLALKVAGKAAMYAWAAAVKLGGAAIALFTGNVKQAKAAWQAFSLALKASPLGLLIGTITAVIGVIATLIHKNREAAAEQARLNKEQADYKRSLTDISVASAQYAQKEIANLNRLYKAATDEAKSKQERLNAIRKLQLQYPEYFGKLSTETIMVGKAKDKYDELTKSIKKSAEARAAQDKVKELAGKKIEAEVPLDEAKEYLGNLKKWRKQAVASRDKARERVSANARAKRRGAKATDTTAWEDYQKNRKFIQKIDREIERMNKKLPELQSKYDDIDKAQDRIVKKYNVDVDAVVADDGAVDPNANPAPTPDPTGYTSQVNAEKERKKQEAEARRAAAKEKKDFKDELNSYKAQHTAADREVTELYKSNAIDYAEMLARQHQNELDYYDSSLTLFMDTFGKKEDMYLEDDKDYQKLLSDRQKSEEEYEKKRVALTLEAINRRKAAEEQSAIHQHDVTSDPTIVDEIALQAKLYEIRRRALNDKQALYTAGSKEYADVQLEIEKLEQDREYESKKLYFKAVNDLRKQYDKKSAAERFELEKKALDALRDAKVLSLELYNKILKAMTEKYKRELPGDDGDNSSPSSKSAISDKDKKQYDKDKAELKSALDQKLISQEEYNRRVQDMDQETIRKGLAGLKQYGGEWNSMLVDVSLSFMNLVDSIGKGPEALMGSIGDCVGAVSSVIGAGMQIATQFAQAESQIQIAAVEKRYDREIELAQGNSYKVRKLEKKKEKETAKIKNEANKKQFAMQVIQAISQSVVAGLNAYSAVVGIPVVGPALAPAAMAVALAMGAAQVALIKKQQQASEAQGYSQGGFTKPGAVDEPAGVVHAGEWVASQKLLANPVARPMIEALDYAQRTNTIGSLRPEDVSRSITANNSLVRIAETDGSSALMVAAAVKMSRTVDSLTNRLKEPFVTVNTVTGDQGIKRAQDEYTRLINNKSPKSRRNAANY